MGEKEDMFKSLSVLYIHPIDDSMVWRWVNQRAENSRGVTAAVSLSAVPERDWNIRSNASIRHHFCFLSRGAIRERNMKQKIIQAEINQHAGFITCKEKALHSLLFLSNWQDWIGEKSRKPYLNKRQNYQSFGIQLAFPKYQLNHKMFMFDFWLEFKCRIPYWREPAPTEWGCGAEQAVGSHGRALVT